MRPRRGRRLVVLIALLLVVGVPLALMTRLPQRLGVWRSPAAELFAQTPDRPAGAALLRELAQLGIPTDGLSVWVFRQLSGTGRLAYLRADIRDGFRFPPASGRDPVLTLFARVAATDAVRRARIVQIALNVRGRDGHTLAVFAADAEDARRYGSGQSRGDAFLRRIDGWADPGATLLTR